MVTYNVSGGGGSAGTAGHPSIKRVPYLVENTIDISQANEDAGTADGDFLQSLSIPAETLVMAAGVEVITALSSSATIDLGWNTATSGNDTADPDRWVDGDTNAVGHGLIVKGTDSNVVFTAADTIDAKIHGAASSVGKIRIWAVMCDISGVNETDTNTTAQHDTEV